MRLNELAATMYLDLTEVINNLNRQGIIANSNTIVIKDLAEKYQLTPNDLYAKMKLKKNDQAQSGESEIKFGYGRMTVEQICQEFNVSVEKGLERLKNEGISAKANHNLKTLATDNGKTPLAIVNIIKGEK